MQIKNFIKLTKYFIAVTMSLTAQIFAAPYDLIDLGTLGGSNNYAFSINSLDEVTGTSNGVVVATDDIDENNPPVLCIEQTGNVNREFCSHAYLFSNGLLTDLGDLGIAYSFGFAINDNSTVVGYGQEIEPDDDEDDTNNRIRERAFIKFADSEMEALPYPVDSNLPDTVVSTQRALDISNNRQVVGYTLLQLTDELDDQITSVQLRPYIYDYDSDTMMIIPLFSDDVTKTGSASSINENGQVVGWALSEEEVSRAHAFFWDPATPDITTDLGTLGGYTSYANKINDVGVVVGVAETSEDFFLNESIAFIYDTAAVEPTMIKIPEFSDNEDFNTSTAYSINNNNMVVGTAQIALGSNPIKTAFSYDFNTDVLTDLNNMIDCSLGWNLIVARDINDNGSIIGTGVVDGEVRSFLLVPTGNNEPTNCVKLREETEEANKPSSGGFGFFSLLFLGLILVARKQY